MHIFNTQLLDKHINAQVCKNFPNCTNLKLSNDLIDERHIFLNAFAITVLQQCLGC